MGGKTKQAQRTKNNSRPSSSGRSAELLGSAVPAFVGFTAIENCGFVPVMPGFATTDNLPDEFDASVDSAYQIVLKKMTKKDPTTKIKALNEFVELLNATEVDKVKDILPFWPRLYGNLATDVEHRVRETTQMAQSVLVSKVGKNIAPFLRQLAPSWITSQYDTYAPASSIATKSFQASFPPHKLKEVFNFCENEILDYVTKNLTMHTPQTLCNPKSYTPEEAEAKYQRLIVCSLKGYSLYLEKIDPVKLNEAGEKNSLLIDNPKFWSYHKHKTAAIRASWFEVIEKILEHALFLLEKHEAQVIGCVFNNLDESEPVVIPHVWAGVLLIQSSFTSWANHVNFPKSFQPKLFKTLKSGGYGCSTAVFPHLLPLISKLTVDILGEHWEKFYADFFDSIKSCLMTPSIGTSRADTTAVATAYYECAQYFFIQIHKTNDLIGSDRMAEFMRDFCHQHIGQVVEWAVTSPTPSAKYIFNQIAKLLNYWSQHVDQIYGDLLNSVWIHLSELISKSLNQEGGGDGDIESITRAHVELIACLRSNMSSGKREIKVKFATDDEVDAASQTTSEGARTTIKNYETDLNDLVVKVCEMYLTRIERDHQPFLIERIESLFKMFDNRSLFNRISHSSVADGVMSDGDSVTGLTKTIVGWLVHEPLKLEIVIDLVLDLFKYVAETDRIALLNTLVQSPDEQIQKWIITRILSHPLCNETYVPAILAQPAVTEHLIQSANHIINNKDTTENINLLHKCFFQTDSGDILIDGMTCARIADIISIPLTTDEMANVLDVCGSFLAQIMPVIFVDERKLEMQVQLFLRLFEFSVNHTVSDDLSEDTLWEITTSWQDALSSNDLVLTDSIVERCSEIVANKLMDSNGLSSIEVIECVSDVVAKLILCSSEHITDETDKLKNIDRIVDLVLNRHQKIQREAMKRLNDLTRFIESNRGAFTSAGKYDEHLDDLQPEFSKLLTIVLLKLNVIVKITCNLKKKGGGQQHGDNEDDEMDDDEELTEDYYDADEHLTKNWTDEIFANVEEIVHVNAVCGILLEVSYDLDEFEPMMMGIGERLDTLIKNITLDKFDRIQANIFTKSTQLGGVWSYALLPFLRVDKYADTVTGPTLLYEDVIDATLTETVTLPKINVLQVMAPRISAKGLPINTHLMVDEADILVQIVSNGCLIDNHFGSDFNEASDQKIIANCMGILGRIVARSKADINYLLYNKDLSEVDGEKIIFVSEVIRFVTKTIRSFSGSLDITAMDFIRIALSSWTLSVSQSITKFKRPEIAIFITSVYKMFETLSMFIVGEKTKSSTEFMTNVIEEWEQIFARDVNLVLLQCFMTMLKDTAIKKATEPGKLTRFTYFLDGITGTIDTIDLVHVTQTGKIDSKTTLTNLIEFCLENISNPCHSVRIAAVNIIKRLANHLIAKDIETLNKYNEQTEKQNKDETTSKGWHILNTFTKTLDAHHSRMRPFLTDFTLKLNDITDLERIDRNIFIPYFLLWECVISICAQSSSEMRSIYASWIAENKHLDPALMTLFRTMPFDVLRNPDTKQIFGQTMFTPLDWKQIRNPTISAERYACHLYAQTLRYLPAAVRKWWNDSNQKQAALVDKITTNFVSSPLCQDELRGVIEKRDKYDNMQITVHTSTREVIATYSIDETKMELIITLPVNHPLGTVKVDGGKQIGGRVQSRVLVMQLTIFLTHQNGSIWDGLSLWKRNLDRKFEGVEECYVCYSVIHQDTCQLPKLSCKTCRKKFHGPCLYKWFSTSNKSTCPICRNIF